MKALAIGILAAASLLGQGPGAADGKNLFEKRCTGCHSPDRDKEGPHLRGVFGRPAGSVPSFGYSDALKNARFTWDAHLLDRWLTDPDQLVPENNMAFRVPNAEERAAIIAYLKELR